MRKTPVSCPGSLESQSAPRAHVSALRDRGPSSPRCVRSSPFEEGPADQRSDVFLHQIEPARLDQVALQKDHQTAGESQEPEDLHVLPGLRHHRVVGGDDQHGQIKSGRSRQHVADEPLMAGNIHERQPVLSQLQGCEAQVDGNPALLLRREPVPCRRPLGPDQRPSCRGRYARPCPAQNRGDGLSSHGDPRPWAWSIRSGN